MTTTAGCSGSLDLIQEPNNKTTSFQFSGCDYGENIQLNHAVQLVGYGSEAGEDYWLVRNSWGEDWGEAGYIRLAREVEPQCGTDTTTSGHVCQVSSLTRRK